MESMINPMALNGKRILVTGASGGIGGAVAKQIAALGGTVILSGRSEARLADTFAALRGEGHSVSPYDLANLEGIADWIAQIVNEGGKLDGLAYCAGIAKYRPLKMTRPAFMQDMFLTNAGAFIETCRVVSDKRHSRDGGSLVGLSSAAARVGNKGQTAYCAGKAAMTAAIRCMARELAPRLRANAVLPSYIHTAIYETYIREFGEEAYTKNTGERQCLGIGDAADVANAVCYLLSDAARFVTGTELVVDGGYLA